MNSNDLKLIRKNLGITQDQLAKTLGITRGRRTIGEWENGREPIPQWVADRLAANSTNDDLLENLVAAIKEGNRDALVAAKSNPNWVRLGIIALERAYNL